MTQSSTQIIEQSTARFTNRVDDYVRARPGYPAEVIDILSRRIGINSAHVVADIGAGTGISTRLFLDHGNTVFAVEPNAAMRDAAVKQFAARPKFHAVDGTAEATTLASASVDLVVAAQAYHWFERRVFAKEIRRIGRPESHLLLMWNERLATGSPFAEAYEKLLVDVSADYRRVDHRLVKPEQIAESFASPPELIVLSHAQVFDFESLKARTLSSSYFPPADDPRHVAPIEELKRIFDRTAVDGRVTMAYRTQLHLGRVHGGAA